MALNACEECGFGYGALPRADLAQSIEEEGRQVAGLLAGSGTGLATRRVPEEWSAVEYGCHLRDVLLVQRDRLYVALVEEEPSFKPMYRDERVEFDRYGEQQPDVVGAQLVMAAAMTAHALLWSQGPAVDQVAHLRLPGPGPSRRRVDGAPHGA